MDRNKFKEVEQKYNHLKEKLETRLITPEEMKAELKKMMVQDEAGNYWMIGGKSGRWYIYNGTDWKEASPYRMEVEAPAEQVVDKPLKTESTMADSNVQTEPASDAAHSESGLGDTNKYKRQSIMDHGATMDAGIGGGMGTRELSLGNGDADAGIREVPVMEKVKREESPQIHEPTVKKSPTPSAPGPKVDRENGTGALSDSQTELQVQVNCNSCKSKIPAYAVYCHVCGANQKELLVKKDKKKKVWEHQGELLITSIRIWSLVFFLGGLGLIIGVLLGASYGLFNDFFTELPIEIPRILADTRGGLAGALVFAAMGGIGGFVVSAVAAMILTGIYNAIAFFFGGIRFNIKH